MSTRTEPVLPPVDAPFRAIVKTMVPKAEELSPEAWDELEAIVEQALAARPPELRRQIRLLIRVLDALPLFRYGRRLRSLPRAKRQRFLERIQSSRIYKLRQGFWGLRSLIYMGYYARAEASVEIGYGARLRGWSDHPDAPESARAGTGAGARAGAGGAGHGDHAGEPLPPGQGDLPGSEPPSGRGHVSGDDQGAS